MNTFKVWSQIVSKTGIAGFFCALSFFASGFHADAQTSYRLNAGGFGVDAVPGWPVYLAQEKGFLAREGIHLNFTRSYQQMMALIGGSFDLIVDGISTTTLAAEKGADIVIVYDLCHRPSQFLVLGRGINEVSDLEKKAIGIGRVDTVDHLVLKKYLTQRNVDINKISFLRTGGSLERFTSLQTGQISATVLSTAYAFRAQQEGMKIAASPKDWDVFPWTYIVLRKPWAEANSDIVVRFVRGIRRSILWLYDPANFDDAVRTLAAITRFEESTTKWALRGSIENKVYSFERPNAVRLQLTVKWLVSEGILSKSFATASTIDPKYYDMAVR
jgi:ABC-type nitrate/sulfonate/bicarbonate transport system substrate-binding protein